MSQVPPAEVFSATEVARAAAVPIDAVRLLIERGELAFVADTAFIALADPVSSGRRLREVALTLQPRESHKLFEPEKADGSERSRKPAALSLAAHAVLIALLVWLSTGGIETAPV